MRQFGVTRNRTATIIFHAINHCHRNLAYEELTVIKPTHLMALTIALTTPLSIASQPEYIHAETGYTAHRPLEAPDPNHVAHYNKIISDLESAKPDYEKLKELWNKWTEHRIYDLYKVKFSEANLSKDQLLILSRIEQQQYRTSLTDEQFKAQLLDLHQQTVSAAVSQLEYERDFPHFAASAKPAERESTFEEDNPRQTNIETILFTWLGHRIISNFQGASNESGEGAKIVRATLGISVRDIERHGILGGPNSYLRQIMPNWGNGERLLGGENSFFRKNLGLPW